TMKFFTPDLLERFGSEDDRIALAAQEELEQRSQRYLEHFNAIKGKLPPRCQEMQERFYLHDARVVGSPFSWFALDPFLPFPADLNPGATGRRKSQGREWRCLCSMPYARRPITAARRAVRPSAGAAPLPVRGCAPPPGWRDPPPVWPFQP